MNIDQVKLAIQLILFVVVLGADFGATWYFTSSHYKALATSDQLAAQQILTTALVAVGNHNTEMELQHEKDLTAIGDLRAHPVRVFLPRQACDSSLPQASGSPVSATSADGATEQAQRAFDEATADMASDAAEWGRALAACRVMQGYIQALP